VLHYEVFDLDEFGATEPDAVLQLYRNQPELGKCSIALDMDVHGFVTVTGVKKEPIRITVGIVSAP